MKSIQEFSDEELLKQSLKNLDCFTKLFERYQHPLIRYIKRISSFSDDDAYEILQDVFIKIWKNVNNFDPSMKFSSWVYRITHNETVSTWKKERKHINRKYEGKLDIEMITTEESLINTLNREYDNHQIQTMLMKISQKYRDVIILRYWENRDYQEIAEILNKPAATIGTLLHRAKKEIQKIMTKQKFEGLED